MATTDGGATYDAIIIGAGHNGLVTALYLARAGWKTLVLEKNERIGGAVMSAEITRPGFIHDLYSTNQNLFLGSPVYRELKEALKAHGLQYAVSERPYCSVFPAGDDAGRLTSVRVYKDPEKTLSLIRAHNPADAAGWSRLYDRFKTFRQALLPLYAQPLPSLAAALTLGKALWTLGPRQLLEQARIILSSTRELGQSYFASPELRALVATWGMHLDFGPDVSGGGMFPFLETFADMEEGMAIAKGGASKMVEALAGLLREHGGEIRTGAEVVRVLQETGRATGVELASGEKINAGRAVVANVTPTILFQQLLPPEQLPPTFRRKVEAYEYGPGTMMIHLALDGPVPWADADTDDLQQFAYVHIAPYVADLARTYEQALNGILPDNPLLVVGQTSAVDPSRAPEGKQVLWLQVRALPYVIEGDAAGELAPGRWDELKEAYADRVLAKLARYAPGIEDRILERVVFSPADLEAHNQNLHNGDSLSGSHHLRQNFLWRPFPGWSTYQMPYEGLYMVGAATWPGAGTNATSGYLAAQQLLNPHALRNKIVRGGAIAGAVAATATAAGFLLARLLGGPDKE